MATVEVAKPAEPSTLPVATDMAQVSLTDKSKTVQKSEDSQGERLKEHTASPAQPQKSEGAAHQKPLSEDNNAKHAKHEKKEESSEDSSEDEHKDTKKVEAKHHFGLSQAVASGLAGAAAGSASAVTGAATSAVLGAMH
jgi:hypothetical protein